MVRRNLTKEQAVQKIRHYCAYQERSHYEVREKLFGFGLASVDVEALIASLIEHDFLNEERFAMLYAGGKFRQKKWGRKRIQYELKLRRISDYNIKRALSVIDPEDYRKTIDGLIDKKKKMLMDDGVKEPTLSAGIINYLISRGFEMDLVRQQLINGEKCDKTT
jgi:regulatory protein